MVASGHSIAVGRCRFRLVIVTFESRLSQIIHRNLMVSGVYTIFSCCIGKGEDDLSLGNSHEIG